MHPGTIHTTHWFAFCRRKLRADVMAAFPTLGTDQVSVLVPGKEELNIVKLYAHRGDAVTVYVSGGNPILFEVEKNLYGNRMDMAITVILAWHPFLLISFIHLSYSKR